MCRLVVFVGACTRCGESQTWDDLTQNLSCLEAKNNCSFGDCTGGIYEDLHEFDQECDRCSEEDEGVGDVGEELDAETDAVDGKRAAEDEAEREAKKRRT